MGEGSGNQEVTEARIIPTTKSIFRFMMSFLSRSRSQFTLLLALTLALPALAVEPAVERLPSRAESKAEETINFSLLDYKGKHYELRRSDARVVVLFFTSFSCPIARQSFPKLKSVRGDFGNKGVAVWLVNPCTADDPDDSMIQMLMMSRRNSLNPDAAVVDTEGMRLEILKAAVGNFPVLRDEYQLVAQCYGVNRTCEVIAIDTKTSTILYRGAIDDQLAEGSQKPKATTNYLTTALNEFLAGKPIANPRTQVHGCRITFETEMPKDPISYTREVAPLLQKNCVGCHSPGQIGPFAMSSYKKVKGWSAMIEEVVLDRRMPPWHADPHYGKFSNDRALTSAESHTLLHWIEQGCPRGDGPDPLTNAAPPVVEWTLGKPDYIVPIPKEQIIPATGTMKYIYLDSDFEMPEDSWLRAAVCRPGNPQVVHHIIVRVLYPKGYKDAPPEAYLFTTWVPGLTASEFPEGTGMFLPKGSRFNFELHYTTMGEATTDLSEVGLYLAKAPAQRRLEVRASEVRDFEIAPGDKNVEHFCHYSFKKAAVIYDLSPHMHFRGSWFKFQLLYPDGKRETLLSVPHYDFNWQTSYRLAEPKHVPAGTWMLCTGAHNNSPTNPFNPDASKTVAWGLQSWNEMFMGFMTVADDLPASSVKAAAKPSVNSDGD